MSRRVATVPAHTERTDLMERSNHRSPDLRSERGSALLISLMVISAMAIVGTALVYNSVADRQISRYDRDMAEALAAAETGVAVAKRLIQDLDAPIEDADADGYPDFTISDSLSWGGTYRVVAEAGEIRDVDIAAYRSDGYTILCEGEARGAKRRVQVQITHDSFLKYARFVEQSGTGYSCNAVLTGELYLGGNLNVPSCSSGDEVTFLEYVAVTGDIPNAHEGIFMRGYVTDAPQIDLGQSVDFDNMEARAKGTAPESDCKGRGSVGFYQYTSGGWDPIGLGSNELDFSKFDFYNTSISPGDTVITYDNAATTNVLTGNPMKRDDFNGVIFFRGDAHLKGVLDGRSGSYLTIFATDDVIADSSIVCGHEGWDPGTGNPNGSGNPINIGLVAKDYFYLGAVPRVTWIDAALMAVENNWRAQDSSTGGHPPLVASNVDLDLNGITGETPNGEGWDEDVMTSDHWVLNINGPIITANGGSAAPWSSGSVTGGAPGPTRRYNYDLDITEFPPPCYPVPLNLWLDSSWTEVFDVNTPLEDLLP